MNLRKVERIIQSYKKHFEAIDKAEIYKWRAVKQFQDNWDIDAQDFARMLEDSLAQANNLMDSGQYFPKRMILNYAQKDSEAVRELFAELYLENKGKTIEDRWNDFHVRVETLNQRYFGNKKSYQDHRAFMVYLALRFPEEYFLFKFKMFKGFVEKVDYPYTPKMGKIENLLVYSDLCEILRGIIVKDEELIEIHKGRLTEDHYREATFNLLTQDVIYATVAHFERFENIEPEKPVFERLVRSDSILIPSRINPIKKSSVNTQDYAEKQRKNKRIGNFGEQLVFRYEQEKLKTRGSKKVAEYVALTDDGKGFDILSYDKNELPIFIEVKTTTQTCEAVFFITATELKKSIEASESYRLYRVYDYNEENDSGTFIEFRGSLESFCTEPILFKAFVTEGVAPDLSASSGQIRA